MPVVGDGEGTPAGFRLKIGDMIDDKELFQPAGLRRAGRRESRQRAKGDGDKD